MQQNAELQNVLGVVPRNHHNSANIDVHTVVDFDIAGLMNGEGTRIVNSRGNPRFLTSVPMTGKTRTFKSLSGKGNLIIMQN